MSVGKFGFQVTAVVPMSDSYVFAASLFYFAVLTLEVAAISLAAFGRDLILRRPRPFGASRREIALH